VALGQCLPDLGIRASDTSHKHAAYEALAGEPTAPGNTKNALSNGAAPHGGRRDYPALSPVEMRGRLLFAPCDLEKRKLEFIP
jgi:hypothetical protein